MFSLLLAIIISASLYRSSVADPGLQGSLSFGSSGTEYYQGYAPTSYYKRPMYTPGNLYFGNLQGFGGNPQDVYLPGRVNPFSYPYRTTRASPSEFKITYIPYLNNFVSPQSSIHEIYETSVKPTSNVNMDRYQLFPYSETYSIYSIPRTSNGEPSSNISFIQGPETVLNSNDSSDISSLQNTKRPSLASEENETSAKRERDLQMTNLGYVPSLGLKADSQEEKKRLSNTMNENIMPFYPLRVDSDSRSVPSSPILFSPYRLGEDKLRQSITNYQESSYSSIRPSVGYPTNPSMALNPMHSLSSGGGFTPYGHIVPQTHFDGTTTHFSGGVRPIVSPFRSRPLRMLSSSLMSSRNPSRYSRTPDQNGYYLFDVEPSKAYDNYGYTKLKSKKHAQMQPNILTQLGYIQPILQVADGIYHSTLGPPSPQSGTYRSTQEPVPSQSGTYRSTQEPAPHQSRTFSQLNFDRLFPNQQDNSGIQNSYNSGAQPILQPFGPSGLSR